MRIDAKKQKKREKFVKHLLKNLDEIEQEIESIYDEITQQADEHIN